MEHCFGVLDHALPLRRRPRSLAGALQQLCAQQVPGDTYRNLRISPEFSGRTFKHVLVPVWLLSYTYGPKAFQVIVNGYTGRIAGRYPKSIWKIVLLVLLAVVAGLIFVLLNADQGGY